MSDYLAKTVTKDVNFNVNVNHHRRRKRELMPEGDRFADDVMFAIHDRLKGVMVGFEPTAGIRRNKPPNIACLCSHWFTIPVKRLFLRGIQSGFVSGTQSLVIRCPHSL